MTFLDVRELYEKFLHRILFKVFHLMIEYPNIFTSERIDIGMYSFTARREAIYSPFIVFSIFSCSDFCRSLHIWRHRNV